MLRQRCARRRRHLLAELVGGLRPCRVGRGRGDGEQRFARGPGAISPVDALPRPPAWGRGCFRLFGAFDCSGLRPLSRGTPPQPLVVKGNLALDQIDLDEDLLPSYQTRAACRTDATPRVGKNYLCSDSR